MTRNVLCTLFAIAFLTFLPGSVESHQQNFDYFDLHSTKYDACNTAAKARFMTTEERQMIQIVNIARQHPALFCEKVVKPWCAANNVDLSSEKYYGSLIKQMSTMQPLGLLQPDSLCFVSAACHAETAGKAGYTGHDRLSDRCRKVKKYNGECCSYGMTSPVDVVMQLLVDEDVESLGHRMILLGGYTKIGAATRPHTTYRTNSVLDLSF